MCFLWAPAPTAYPHITYAPPPPRPPPPTPQVDVYSQTTNQDGTEVKPEWGDCTAALNLLRDACGDGSITGWTCDLFWGNCPNCGWGSCIRAQFTAPALCGSSVSVGANGAGPSISAGLTKLGTVVNAIFGTPNC